MLWKTAFRVWVVAVFLAMQLGGAQAQAFAQLDASDTVSGYLARLLINETPFPGELGYESEDDTKTAMLAILWVVHSRVHHIPAGYTQEQVAAIRSDNVIDIITAGGEKGQCDGFYKDAQGRFVSVPRVEQRIQYLLKIANSGGKPGKFAALLNYAQDLARTYVKRGLTAADRYVDIRKINRLAVTGRGFGWMTDRGCNPGGNFVAIPDSDQGSLGHNRFFTLRKEPK
jgi:hypothetical protein